MSKEAKQRMTKSSSKNQNQRLYINNGNNLSALISKKIKFNSNKVSNNNDNLHKLIDEISFDEFSSKEMAINFNHGLGSDSTFTQGKVFNLDVLFRRKRTLGEETKHNHNEKKSNKLTPEENQLQYLEKIKFKDFSIDAVPHISKIFSNNTQHHQFNINTLNALNTLNTLIFTHSGKKGNDAYKDFQIDSNTEIDLLDEIKIVLEMEMEIQIERKEKETLSDTLQTISLNLMQSLEQNIRIVKELLEIINVRIEEIIFIYSSQNDFIDNESEFYFQDMVFKNEYNLVNNVQNNVQNNSSNIMILDDNTDASFDVNINIKRSEFEKRSDVKKEHEISILEDLAQNHNVYYYQNELKKLDLSFLKLNVMPAFLFLMQNLRTLEMVACKIKTIPQGINALSQLTLLDLSHNSIAHINSLNLSKLVTLKMSNNKIQSVYPNLFIDTILVEVDLSYNLIEKLPENLGSSVQNMKINNCKIKTLPNGLYDLHYLTELVANSNCIRRLDKDINKLKNLKNLIIGCNLIEELPDTLCDLENLTVLNISYNKLKHLPKRINQLKNLIFLEYKGNQILSNSLTKYNEDFIIDVDTISEYMNLKTRNYTLYPSINETNSNLTTNRPEIVEQMKQLEQKQNANNKKKKFDEQIINAKNNKEHLPLDALVETFTLVMIVEQRFSIDAICEFLLMDEILTPDIKHFLFNLMQDKQIHNFFKVSFGELFNYCYTFILSNDDQASLIHDLNKRFEEVVKRDICDCLTCVFHIPLIVIHKKIADYPMFNEESNLR
jgi:Leucine-rich repeat (LRR) protein